MDSVVTQSGRCRAGFTGVLLLLVGLIGAMCVAGHCSVAAAAESPSPVLWQGGQNGSAAGNVDFPRGMAADPSNGHIYLADQFNFRIDEFTPWGRFVRAWGWDIVESGPGDDVTAPEDQFEVCIPASGDTCKAGLAGGGSGQVDMPQGIALDSSGNVYVTEGPEIPGNRRVSKFDPSTGPSGDQVQFISMFGGKVNKTKVEEGAPDSEQNQCPIAPDDVCQEATQGTGPGQFGRWVPGDYIDIDSKDNVYVGDEGRIQRFDAAGVYQEEISLPGKTVQSLDIDSTDSLYVAYFLAENVHKLSASGTSQPPIFEASNPTAISVDSEGNVFVFDQGAIHLNDPNTDSSPILKYDPVGSLLTSFGKGEFAQSTSILTNFCEGSQEPGNFYVANLTPLAFLRAYGTPPVGCEQQPPVAPVIKAQFATSITVNSAQLKATINPEFWEDTSYFIEYGTGKCTEGGCSKRAPLGAEASLGGGVTNADLTTSSVFLSGLSPSITYHYRFVAKSSGGGPTVGDEASFLTLPLPTAGKTDCPNQVFRTGPSASLPDCRAFEMVSPIDKNGAGIETAWLAGNPLAHGTLDQSDAEGEALAYSSKQAFGDTDSSPFASQYIGRRHPASGWATQSVNAPRAGFAGLDRQYLDTEFKAFKDDLSQGWLIHEGEPPLSPCAPPNSPDLYRRDNSNGSYEVLHCQPNQQKNGPNTIELQGTSQDGCRAIFRSNSKLTEDAEPNGPYQLYESRCDGSLRLVSVLPDQSLCKKIASAGTGLPNVDGAVADGRRMGVLNAFSGDARRLYWECGGTLYLRSDPDPVTVGEPDEGSLEVAKQRAGEAARFEAASPDGSRVLFISYEQVSGKFQLQSYEPETAVKTLIANTFKDIEGRVDLLGASEDAKRAYLVSGEKLTSIPNSEGDVAEEGKPNLFFFEEGGGFDFVGTLSSGDLKRNQRVLSPVHPLRFRRASRVTPDGLTAAFISSSQMTGYDNTDSATGEADAEVFVYDASAKKIRCVSCNPSGARPVGRNISQEVVKSVEFWAAAWIPGWMNQLTPGRPLSEDGSRLFFNSIDPLVNRDTNGAQDVYEWEAADSKDECLKELGAELYVPTAGGCISLISTGQDPNDSEFVDADKDASDVFIRTAESLVVQDPGLTDIYDARVNGGFPPPPAPAPECEGEACQSPPAPPSFTGPASSNYVGPPNPKPKKACPKGKKRVKSKGKSRCVARKAKKQSKGKGKAKQRQAQPKHGRAGR